MFGNLRHAHGTHRSGMWVGIGMLLTLIVTQEFPATKQKSLRGIFSPLARVNRLAAARIFLFGARDVWQAIALPIFIATAPNWGFWQSGSVMALYTIGYGFIQALTPRLLRNVRTPDGRITALLALIPALICVAGAGLVHGTTTNVEATLVVVLIFSVAFAVNSAVHSFLIAAYAEEVAVSLDIGLYYSANAFGRLCGTFASGLLLCRVWHHWSNDWCRHHVSPGSHSGMAAACTAQTTYRK